MSSKPIDLPWKPIAIPLHGFDYVHSPYVHSPDDENIRDSWDLYAGRDALINRLVSLLKSGHRKRGSYLIAGYRGAGKTSIVNRAIEQYTKPDKVPPPKKTIVIKINLGDNSQLTPLNIYFSIANFLLEEFSSDNGKLTHIKEIKKIKEKLEGLVDRMGHEISDNRGFGTATNAGVDAETGPFLNLFSSIKGRLGASVEVSNSKSKRMLPISPREAEEQVLKILVSINKDANSEVIFIFDEIDKLSNSEEFTASSYQRRASETLPQDKHARINTLLGSLKNFITTAEATFFFISGRETLDRYYSEKGSPNSLYESLFDSVFEVPSLLTDDRYYSSRAPGGWPCSSKNTFAGA